MNNLFSRIVYTYYILLFLFSYTIIYSFYHLSGENLFKVITNMMAMITIIYTYLCLLFFSIQNGLKRRDYFFLISLILVFSVNFIVNLGHTNILDFIKLSFIMMSIIYFSYLGEFTIPNKLIYFMIFSPILIQILGGSHVYHNGVSFGFFQNTNTAFLYFVALLGIWVDQNDIRKMSYIPLILALLFQKMGALMSSLLALVIVYRRFLFKYIYILSIFLLLFVYLLYLFGVLERPISVFEGLYNVFSNYSLSDISSLSYEHLIYITGSKDISAIFRIKHWSEIINYYLSQGVIHWFFGIGARESVHITSLGLVPHNDYLRVFCEFGFFIFLFWVYIYRQFLREISKKEVKTICLILMIYYFSENLIDGFVTMYLLHLLFCRSLTSSNYHLE